jgi:nitroreductase
LERLPTVQNEEERGGHAMDFSEVIKKRYSVRSYQPDPVEPEKLKTILEAARLAPTAVNYQPFKVFVIRNYGCKKKLKTVYPKEWFVEAPLVLGVCINTAECWTRRDGKSFADVDAAIVMDHMILAATALGLGTCWIGAFDRQAARELLQITDQSWEPVVFTPLGYPRETPSNRTGRKPLEELVVYL